MEPCSLAEAQDIAVTLRRACWVVNVPGDHRFVVVFDLKDAPAGHTYCQPFRPSGGSTYSRS